MKKLAVLAFVALLSLLSASSSEAATAFCNPWSCSAISQATSQRLANTTTYTANTGWNSTVPTYLTFPAVCRANGTQVLIPEIDIYSNANPATKLQGILWLFTGAVATPVNDNATFNITAADYANLSGNMQGFPFTLVSNQAAGATNSGISLTGTTYHAACDPNSTAMYGLVQVVNAYPPANSEVLTVRVHALAVN